MQELLDLELLVQQQGAEAKPVSSWSAIADEAGGGFAARRNLNGPFTELCRTGQGRLKPSYLKQGPQGIMRGSTQAWQDGI